MHKVSDKHFRALQQDCKNVQAIDSFHDDHTSLHTVEFYLQLLLTIEAMSTRRMNATSFSQMGYISSDHKRDKKNCIFTCISNRSTSWAQYGSGEWYL